MRPGYPFLHPFTILFYFMGYALLSIVLLHPIYLITGILGIILINYSIDRTRFLRGFLPFYLLTGVTIALVNPLFTHRGRHILFYFLNQPITAESVMYGITMMLSLLNILICSAAYNQEMTSGKFLFLFSRAFQKTGLLLMLSIRFVPLFKRRMEEIRTVQMTRDINPLEGRLRKRIKDATVLIQILITWSLEEALQTADSMKARGYGMDNRRGSYMPYRMRSQDFLTLGLLLVSGGVCIGGWLHGYGTLAIYPSLEWHPFTHTQWIIYCSFILFMVTPLLIKGKEAQKWKFWN
ncbi:energy-coupling factor transporter transmembrane component T [Aneurinibacillus sp. Ricciae_BoGa-3]|uniref:energy-coupling factor transporter transmembrane component T n=1 Tax=Aneurinibacillus sp. Ricciae_BoGa-3 TaxID=3022697 RepID=UPI002341CA0E|nr:energy-coupling factor transporter transmembrane component T [Aneurinibacillus sp. Ricciae_BoGa-3]WCK56604.1 energy-coupling factor transporter transmembrane component T [Aneurinibacillus sp. Ricciae_BoGa-3]